MPTNSIHILGLPFTNLSVEEVIQYLNQNGGLLTVPSGPGLSTIPWERTYYESLQRSDMIIADSGLMAIIWNKILRKPPIRRTSGLKFINSFIHEYPQMSVQREVFLVNPNEEEGKENQKYLSASGISVDSQNSYSAPFYKGDISDEKLLALLEERRPHWIFLNIGGGTQEILGAWLKEHLSYRPAIICTGAAIAFKTGKQVQIPEWVDKYYLGWLWRVMSNPKVYGKRFWDAKKAAYYIIKYQDRWVPAQLT